MRNVWDIPTAGNEKYKIEKDGVNIDHPTQKPIEVIKRCIMTGIKKSPESVVLDIFAGSGTTGIASAMLGYNSILVENDKKYFELMKSRIEHTFNDSVKIILTMMEIDYLAQLKK